MNSTDYVEMEHSGQTIKITETLKVSSEAFPAKRYSLFKMFLSFFKIGAFTFGGGWAMMPLIKNELVDHHEWLNHSEFVDILAIAQSGPGSLGVNISMLCGYKMGNLPGCLIAMLGTVLPPFLTVLVAAVVLKKTRNSKLVEAVFKGMRPVIFALLISATLRLGKKTIKSEKDVIFAVLGAFFLLCINMNPLLVVLVAAIGGVLYGVIQCKTPENR